MKDDLRDSLALGTSNLASRVFKPGRPAFVIAVVVGVLILTALVVFFVLQLGTVVFREPVHRYENGVRIDYQGETRLRRSDNSFLLQNAGQEAAIPGDPLYFADLARVFVPEQMIYVDPSNTRPLARTGYNTLITGNGGNTHSAVVNGKTVQLEAGFLFDGRNTYLFLEPMVLLFNGQKLNVAAYTYAIVHYGLRVEIYPVGEDENIFFEQGDFELSAVAEGKYTVDLSLDILKTDAGDMLLFTQPSLLEFLQ